MEQSQYKPATQQAKKIAANTSIERLYALHDVNTPIALMLSIMWRQLFNLSVEKCTNRHDKVQLFVQDEFFKMAASVSKVKGDKDLSKLIRELEEKFIREN